MPTILGRRFRILLDRRGLLVAPNAHEERFAFMLSEGPVLLDRHPAKVREAVMIARELFGDGLDEHGALTQLYAKREDLECPLAEPREIAWIPHSADGPGLNPEKWVRLDAWLDDQFLLEDALQLRYGRDAI